MTPRILEEVAEDIEAGRDYYDAQEFGIGDYFADTIIADIQSLSVYAGVHSVHLGYFRKLARTFPFGIYYKIEEEEPRVYAVLDLRDEPSWLRSELRRRS